AARPGLAKDAAELVRAVSKQTGASGDGRRVREQIAKGMETLARVAAFPPEGSPALDYLRTGFDEGSVFMATALAWVITHNLGALRSREDAAAQGVALMDELLLGKAFAEALRGHGLDAWAAAQRATLLAILTGYHRWADTGREEECLASFRDLLNDGDARLYLGFNRYNGVLWFNRERLETLLYWLYTVSVLGLAAEETASNAEILRGAERRFEIIRRIRDAAEASGYEADRFTALLAPAAPA
ncbi:MAG TPA: hypothetical protein PLI86_11715, partial [bacterium]|nr:hypothetical protein [bacterium]